MEQILFSLRSYRINFELCVTNRQWWNVKFHHTFINKTCHQLSGVKFDSVNVTQPDTKHQKVSLFDLKARREHKIFSEHYLLVYLSYKAIDWFWNTAYK